MTITEAAQNVNRSRQTIYNYVKSGKLKAKRNGVGYEIDLEDLQEAFAKSNEASKSVNEVSSDPSTVDTSNRASNRASNEVSNFDKTVDALLQQLDEKDKQIGQLHQIIAMQQKTISEPHLALEDLRQPKPSLWQRVLGKISRA